MANFSVDYGNAHWTVLDANPYVDWSGQGPAGLGRRRPRLGPGFHLAVRRLPPPRASTPPAKHYEQQQMRALIADVLEAGKVDMVFNGHVHNYQRTRSR